MHCRVWNLCNQLLPEFSINQFETMHTCCEYIWRCAYEFWQSKILFDKITAFSTEDHFQVSLQHRIAKLCNQLLPEFSSNQFETLNRCYKDIEDMHVTFSKQGNNF